MRPGEVVANRFELEHLAGSGGMGAVWRARDVATGGAVALKVMLSHTTERARFVREAEVLASLRHESIVRYVAHGVTDDGLSYLAMEWLDGCDLATRLARGPVRSSDALVLALRLAEALGEAHAQGVVHRDVKPANVFLPGDRLEDAKLIDFGIAYLQALTHTTGVIGTIGYMAPEQARSGSTLDARTDVFSLGCVLFECLVGRPVFSGEHAVAVLAKVVLHEPPRLADVLAGVPPELDDLVARMLNKDPAARPRDAREVAAALRVLVERPTSLTPQLAKRPPALTAEELRVASIVLVARPGDRADAQTVAAGDAQRDAQRLGAEAAKFGATAFRLVDGSVLALAVGDVPSDQAAQAARCALALHRLMPDRGAAIATGRAALDRKVPLGEAIDAAAAMLRAADVHGVRIDDATAGLLGARFDVRDRVLIAEHADRSHVRTLLGKPVPCVGRDRELAVLEGLLEECTTEPVARVALVTGVAGSGKSRVVQELVARARERLPDLRVGHAGADPMGGRSPLSVLADALRHAIGLTAQPRTADQQAMLRARVDATVARDAERVTWFLAEMLGIPFEAHAEAQLAAARGDPRLMADQVRRAFEDFVCATAASEPVLFVLEDLQWADPASVALVDSALRRAADLPVMVVATARSDFRERFPSLWVERHLQEIKLGALSPRAGAALVRAVLSDADEATTRRLFERSEGNALFLEELIRAEAEGSTAASGERLPGSVLAMVVARVERLPAELRRVMRAASVLGRTFWTGAVRALVDVDEPTLDAALGELVTSELVVEHAESKFVGERELAFRHALTRDAAYGMLTPSDATLGHRLAGEWLEQAGDADARSLAAHFEKGAEPARALTAYVRAAQQALAANDLSEVVALADKGITCGAAGDALGTLHLLQAQSQFWRGALADAFPCAVAATEELTRGTAGWSRAVGLVGNLEARRGHFDGAEIAARRLLARAHEAVPDAALADSLLVLASALLFGDRSSLSLELAKCAAPVTELHVAARRHEYESLRSFVCDHDPEGALRALEPAAVAFERVGNLRMACNTRSNVAFFRHELGDLEGAAREIENVMAQAKALGLREVLAIAKQNLGPVRAARDDLDAAIALERDARDELASLGNARMEGFARAHLATFLLRRGDLGAAEAEAVAAIARLDAIPSARAFAHAVLSQIARKAGRTAEALGYAEAAATALEALSEGEAFVRLALAEALDAAGQGARARAVLAEAHARLVERAARVHDERLRASFLSAVPDNARTLELARAWGVSEAAR